MCEILFRGKRTDNGEWIAESETYIKDGDGTWLSDESHDVVKVIPETVGQFTGLTDKNGVKIFEGDIVRLTDEYNEIEWTAVVVFGNPNGEYNWGWQLRAIGEFDGNKDILLWVDTEDFRAYCEIIGNIFDNPELMKGGNNNG